MRLRALALLSCVPWWFTAMPATANTELIGAPVQFHGTVVSRPCNIEPQSADQLVEMGTVIVKPCTATATPRRCRSASS